ncbi:hypothetical protein E1091_02020 [Micromonospora fluostatini]|uniref:Holin n=1 Tax=Micromonospora fluostatini TaxID=1629071 RepID=A0ABY2DL92_9ACTN|nr:hypothetical protein E1091_02020 [Micromonospora fluostatini]
MSWERLKQHVRDYACITAGLSILYQQTWVADPGQHSEILVTAAVALLTGPAVGGAIALRRETRATSAESGSPSEASSSPPDSSRPAS